MFSNIYTQTQCITVETEHNIKCIFRLLPPEIDDWFLHRCEEVCESRLKPERLKYGQKIKCSRDHSAGIKNMFGTHFCSCPTCVSEMGLAQTYVKARAIDV